MRRKAGAGRPPPEIGTLTAARAFRTALARAAQEVLGLAAVAGDVSEQRITLEPATENLPEAPLLALLEGPLGGFGLMVLDGQTVAALIEVQTTGRVVPRPAEARRPTRTDAVMCADFIDQVLMQLQAQLDEADLPVAPAFAEYRYAMALADTQAMGMTLEDLPYRQLSVMVDFGHGAKSGRIAVLLPFDPPSAQGAGGDGTGFSEALRSQVLETRAHLSATLARHEMTLAEVTLLRPGSVIAVPLDALASVRIEDVDGHTIALGRLGQAEGHRAVRLLSEDAGTGSVVGGLDGPGAQHAPEVPAVDAGQGMGLGELGAIGGNDDLPDLAALGDLGDLGNLGDVGDFAGGAAAPAADLPEIDGLADLGSFSDPVAATG